MYSEIDKDSDIPIHHQLYLILEKKIQDGDYPAGSIMPSEAELQSQYGISRITVRRAISDLEKYGYVRRKRGWALMCWPRRRTRSISRSAAFRRRSE